MINPDIKRIIETRFGRPVLYSKDCEALSLSIKKVCNETVSVTTLKRMMGFATEIHVPRLFTLDVIARYCGFSDWKTFLRNHSNSLNSNFENYATEDAFYLQQESSVFISTQRIEIDRVFALCEQFGGKTGIYHFVIDIIKLAANVKDINFLKVVFNLPKIYNFNSQNDGKIYYLGHVIGMVLRNFPDLAEALIAHYSVNPVSQKIMVEWFMDEDHLNGYYGKLLDNFANYRKDNSEDLLFYYSLKYTQSQQSADFESCRNWFQKIQDLVLLQRLTPVLAGRFLGIRLTEEPQHQFSTNSSLYHHALIYMDDSYENSIVFLLFCFRYLYKNGNQAWISGLARMFEKHFRSMDKLVMSYKGVKMENTLSMYLAYNYFLEGKIERAIVLIDKVDTHLFPVYIYKQLEKDYHSIRHLIRKPSMLNRLPVN